MLSESIRRNFLAFCDRETDPRSFEAWVLAAEDVEAGIGHGPYLDLISTDYQGREAEGARDQCANILEHHHPGSLARYRVRRILRSMIEDQSATIVGLRKLVHLRHSGYEFIPIEFVGFDSETDHVPTPDRYSLWDAAALAELLGKVEPYLHLVRQACQDFVDDLGRRYPDDV